MPQEDIQANRAHEGETFEPMKMSLKRCLVPLLSGLGMLCAVMVGTNLNNPAEVVKDSFGRALSNDNLIASTNWDFGDDGATDVNLSPRGLIVPAFDSRQASLLVQAPQATLLMAGDELVLSRPDRSANRFRVLSVEALPSSTETRFDTSLNSTRKLLITARDLSDKQGRVMRFVVDINLPADLSVQRAGAEL